MPLKAHIVGRLPIRQGEHIATAPPDPFWGWCMTLVREPVTTTGDLVDETAEIERDREFYQVVVSRIANPGRAVPAADVFDGAETRG